MTNTVQKANSPTVETKKTVPCGTLTKKSPLHKPALELVTFETGIQKFYGVYRKLDAIMCRPCYQAISKREKRTCRFARTQTGDVVTRKDYVAWRIKQEELLKIQEKLEAEQKLALLKAGKLG